MINFKRFFEIKKKGGVYIEVKSKFIILKKIYATKEIKIFFIKKLEMKKPTST